MTRGRTGVLNQIRANAFALEAIYNVEAKVRGFIEELRSGKHKQITGKLIHKEFVENTEWEGEFSYCTLGMLIKYYEDNCHESKKNNSNSLDAYMWLVNGFSCFF